MPKAMPDLAGAFARATDGALDLALAGELARLKLLKFTLSVEPLHLNKLDLLYELAYLRCFIQWEVFLEQSFLRYLCGYTSSMRPEVMAHGTYFADLASAEVAVLKGKAFRLWHKPSEIISRARGFFQPGKSYHEIVIASNLSRLEHFAAIRHRIAHAQEHARIQFDSATMSLAAKRYKGGRPGRFLRDWESPSRRWLDAIADELKSLSLQITP